MFRNSEKVKKTYPRLLPKCSFGSSGAEGELEKEAEMEAAMVSDVSWAFATTPALL